MREGDSGSTGKQYDIPFAALPRYFHTYYDSGVRSMQLILDKGSLDRPLSNDSHYIENSKASLVCWFDAGSHVSC